MFGIIVNEKVGAQKMFYFLSNPHLTCDSALPGKTRKHETRTVYIYILIGLSRCVATGRDLRCLKERRAGTSKAGQMDGRADGKPMAQIERVARFWLVLLKCHMTALPDISQLLFDFFDLVDSRAAIMTP